jgi:hypothetical protein
LGQSFKSVCAGISVALDSETSQRVWGPLTVKVRADVETTGLAGRDGLRDGEKGGSERADALLEENGASIHGGSGCGNLDTEAIPDFV